MSRFNDQAAYDKTLRPWADVARQFTQITGIRMTHKNACVTARRGLAKLRDAILKDPSLAAMVAPAREEAGHG